jgi:hypothetical protein
MSETQPETVLKFEIKSLDSSQPTIESVPAAEGLSSALQVIVGARFPGATVKIRRAEGIPGLREVQELLLHVDWHAVKTGVETTIGSFVAKEFLKLMKAKLRNVFVKPVPAQSGPLVTESVATSAARSEKGRPAPRKKKVGGSRKSSRSTKKSRSTRNKRKR